MKKLTVLLIVLISIFSCKKNKPEPTCTTDMASIAGQYKITGYTYKAGPQFPEIDYYTTVFPDACDRDNAIKFNADGTYQLLDIGLVCSPSGNDSGTWKLTGNTVTIDGDETILESFNCKTLILVNTDTNQQGDRLKIILTK